MTALYCVVKRRKGLWLLKDTLPFSLTTVKDGLHKQRNRNYFFKKVQKFQVCALDALFFFFWCCLTWVLNGMVKVHISGSRMLPDLRIPLPFFFAIFVKESLFSLWKDCSHASEHFFPFIVGRKKMLKMKNGLVQLSSFCKRFVVHHPSWFWWTHRCLKLCHMGIYVNKCYGNWYFSFMRFWSGKRAQV